MSSSAKGGRASVRGRSWSWSQSRRLHTRRLGREGAKAVGAARDAARMLRAACRGGWQPPVAVRRFLSVISLAIHSLALNRRRRVCVQRTQPHGAKEPAPLLLCICARSIYQEEAASSRLARISLSAFCRTLCVRERFSGGVLRDPLVPLAHGGAIC